ncbi:Ku protein [Streptomyces mirabilis]|uniref:Ku protein n=1 Tax=Streptomyces mirabilis TaxID=68239 RepID=UPI003667566A
MPRPLWSGAISFGLVTIPVKLMSATEDRSVRFHQVHAEDLGRVLVRKYCEAEDREVSAGEIGKGYEVAEDTLVAITDEELERMPLPTAKAIEIVAFAVGRVDRPGAAERRQLLPAVRRASRGEAVRPDRAGAGPQHEGGRGEAGVARA